MFSLFIETGKARDKRSPLNKPSNPTSQATPQAKQPHKPSNPTSKANLQRSQKQIKQHAEQLFEESKQASTPPNKVNSSKKAVSQQLKQLFEERRKALPEDTAFVNN